MYGHHGDVVMMPLTQNSNGGRVAYGTTMEFAQRVERSRGAPPGSLLDYPGLAQLSLHQQQQQQVDWFFVSTHFAMHLYVLY